MALCTIAVNILCDELADSGSRILRVYYNVMLVHGTFGETFLVLAFFLFL